MTTRWLGALAALIVSACAGPDATTSSTDTTTTTSATDTTTSPTDTTATTSPTDTTATTSPTDTSATTSPTDTTVAATDTSTDGDVVATDARPWVTGYYAGWFWDQMYPPDEVAMGALTHFVFGRVAPGGGSLGGTPGTVVLAAGSAHDAGLAPDGSGRSVEDYLVARAHAAGVRALLMLGGDGLDGIGFLLSTPDALRPTFVKNIVDYLAAHDYDGVDVDWENRLDGDPDLGVDAAEARRRLLALIHELRAEAATRPRWQGDDRLIVTFPGYAVSINFLEPGGKVEAWQAEVALAVDQYNLMSYGIGTAYNGGGWDAWFSSPIGGASGTTPYDLTTSIAAYEATGVPRARLGIGIGLYGIYYGPTITGPRQSTEGNDIFEVNDVALAYAELVRKGYLDHGVEGWDEVAQSSYRSYPDGYVPAVDPGSTPAGFLSYETPRSIAAKGRWVRDTGVGGAIVWTLNYGYLPSTGTNPLLDAVGAAFLGDAPP